MSESARRSLRYWPAWGAVGWLLVAAVVFLSLTPSPPQVGVEQGDKLGHLLAYAVLMGWFSLLYRTRRAHTRIALLLILMGLALEVLQGWSGYRNMDPADMAANTLGVALAWMLAATRLSGALEYVEGRLGA
jgi:VanZ family protein